MDKYVPVYDMVVRKHGLTLRQAQALISIAYRKNVFGIVRFSDLITDMGVAFATLADHLQPLKNGNFIRVPKKHTHSLGFSDEITITLAGGKLADKLMHSIDASYGNTTMQAIFEKLRVLFEPEPQLLPGYQIDLNFNRTNTKTSSFAKAFKELVIQNPTEPVLTSITMYTDLDSQLSLMRVNDNIKYKLLSRAKLNLEIRNGRLASIAIPAAIRGTARFAELQSMLSGSWSWTGAVASRSNRRYWQEATSLGLLQINGESVISSKPAPVDTIKWLASKTYFTFINTIPIAPKSSLVLYRESFKLPTEEDLLDPANSDLKLDWLNSIWNSMNDRTLYKETVTEGLRILRDDAKLLQSFEGRLIPTTVFRMINSVPELSTRFRTIMQHEDMNLAKILIAINQKPAITTWELCSDLNKHATHKISIDELWNMISLLIPINLVQATTNRSVTKENTSLFSFIHLPFLRQTQVSKHGDETNAVIRSIKPYLLHLIKELFVTEDERKAVYDIFNELMKEEYVDFESIEKTYSSSIARKIAVTGRLLDPFVTLNQEYTRISLNQRTVGLNKVLLDSLLYSILTQNDGLEIYNNMIAALVEKDKPWATDMDNEVRTLTTALIQQSTKSG